MATAATILAFPVAYFLAFKAGNRAGLYLALLAGSRSGPASCCGVMAWKVMLGSNGVINSLLISAGAITEPLQFPALQPLRRHRRPLIYVWIPFVTLPILAALQRIDRLALRSRGGPGRDTAASLLAHHAAARAARRTGRVLHVLHPDGRRICHPPAGGRQRWVPCTATSSRISSGKAANWPLGAAMSLIMLAREHSPVVSFALKVHQPPGPGVGRS